MIALFALSSCKQTSEKAIKKQETDAPLKSVRFTYQEVKGIGHDSLFNRRDNSDIIQVDGTYYVWYTKMESPQTAGYWGSIWYATSVDEGLTWKEQGMALGLGREGKFDSQSVFTPNILTYEGRYYLYYTGVKPTPGNKDHIFENNSINDITAIGLAVADHPKGPFKRVENNPILEISQTPEAFDSYRIDDASLLVRDDKIGLYYKGRSIIHGKQGPSKTQMGVAYAQRPEGPYVKHDAPLLDKSHEVLIWKKDKGVAALASISSSISYAEDGIHFITLHDSLTDIPQAPGLYRPDLESSEHKAESPVWGIAMKGRKGLTYLTRYEMK
ncbi:family 43 glycosylhydrolase [Zobellia galactanivorans]|uniref:family 43 glycosylhydrolase n=1 Tax=Zobellia galactanivorans (strain DSM 12802 / CCUG 47099 / CIP 106680 / NCIMB 13871 / Dsij) TaxID=63186 RepID=UPI0026E24C52|nr:family 43 glycosylhydrolase [Zobellia galactanivorans]MDO6807177.1 family 43 glycosylhydrolase [Zobellia galactanivorans]